MMREARAGAILCPLVYSFPLMLSLLSLLACLRLDPRSFGPRPSGLDSCRRDYEG